MRNFIKSIFFHILCCLTTYPVFILLYNLPSWLGLTDQHTPLFIPVLQVALICSIAAFFTGMIIQHVNALKYFLLKDTFFSGLLLYPAAFFLGRELYTSLFVLLPMTGNYGVFRVPFYFIFVPDETMILTMLFVSMLSCFILYTRRNIVFGY